MLQFCGKGFILLKMQLFLPKEYYTSDDAIKFNNNMDDFFRGESLPKDCLERLRLLSNVLNDIFGDEWSFFRDISGSENEFLVLIRYKDLVIKNTLGMQYNSRNVFACIEFERDHKGGYRIFPDRLCLQKTSYTNNDLDKLFVHPHHERLYPSNIVYGTLGSKFCFGTDKILVALATAFLGDPWQKEQYKSVLFKYLLNINDALHREDLEGTAYISLDTMLNGNRVTFSNWFLFMNDFSNWINKNQKTISLSIIKSREVIISDKTELKTLMQNFIKDNIEEHDYMNEFLYSCLKYDKQKVQEKKEFILKNQKEHVIPYFYFNNEKLALEFLDDDKPESQLSIVLPDYLVEQFAEMCNKKMTRNLYNVLYSRRYFL